MLSCVPPSIPLCRVAPRDFFSLFFFSLRSFLPRDTSCRKRALLVLKHRDLYINNTVYVINDSEDGTIHETRTERGPDACLTRAISLDAYYIRIIYSTYKILFVRYTFVAISARDVHWNRPPPMFKLRFLTRTDFSEDSIVENRFIYQLIRE